MLRTRHLVLFSLAAATVFILAACTTPAPPASAPSNGDQSAPAITSTEENAAPAASDQESTATESQAPASSTSAPASTEIIIDDTPPPFSTRSWKTDFTKRSVQWEEILSGGPPKDGIPSIDDPTFESIADASTWLTERDPVILFQADGVTRAYPLSILIWHEIVNDQVGEQPVTITFCPLCNASIAFDRRLEGQVLDFGTTGKLRNSDLVMYDRQTESFWQQFTGEAIVGEFTGKRLTFLPSQVISFGDFVKQFPDGEVLARPSRDGQFLRSYGRNPYVGYDSSTRPFLFTGVPDPRLPATERIVGITTETAAIAYPFSVLQEVGVINDEFEGTPVVVFHKAGTASALDQGVISGSKDVGSAAAFDRRLGDQTLTFAANGDGTFTDAETGSTWDILGVAVDGPLAGSQLDRILSFDHFWFAWAAFFPSTQVYGQ